MNIQELYTYIKIRTDESSQWYEQHQRTRLTLPDNSSTTIIDLIHGDPQPYPPDEDNKVKTTSGNGDVVVQYDGEVIPLYHMRGYEYGFDYRQYCLIDDQGNQYGGYKADTRDKLLQISETFDIPIGIDGLLVSPGITAAYAFEETASISIYIEYMYMTNMKIDDGVRYDSIQIDIVPDDSKEQTTSKQARDLYDRRNTKNLMQIKEHLRTDKTSALYKLGLVD